MSGPYYGQGWSDRNPVPTIHEYETEVAQRKRESDDKGRDDTSTMSRFVGMLRHADEVAIDKLNTNHVVDANNKIVESSEPSVFTGVHGTPNAADGAAEFSTLHEPAAASGVAAGAAGVAAGAAGVRRRPTKASARSSQPPMAEHEAGDNTTVTAGNVPDKSELDTDDEEDLQNAYMGDQEEFGKGKNEKERIKEAASSEPKPLAFQNKGDRMVNDPVTHRPVLIRDSKDSGRFDPKMLDSRYPQGFSQVPMVDPEMLRNKYTSPDPAQPTSVLLQRFPAPVDTDAMRKLANSFDQLSLALATAIGFIWLSVAFGHGWLAFFFRTMLIGTGAVIAWFSVAIAFRRIEKEFEDVRAHMHRQRGKHFSPPTPESVEWLNSAVACIWKQINPDMFVSMIDMVEDIMQSSLPAFIDAVKISDFGLGEHPLRFIAMRGLADLMTDPEYPRRTWIERSDEPEPHDASEEVKKSEENDNAGDFLNMEVSFCYSAIPGESSSKRAQNIHLLIEFFIGAFDLFEIPLPIWIQIERLIGTVRFRAQIVSEPPYLRYVAADQQPHLLAHGCPQGRHFCYSHAAVPAKRT